MTLSNQDDETIMQTTEEATETSTDDKEKEDSPLEAAAKRLEFMLGNQGSSSSSSPAAAFIYTNPSKVVRRWLTTSSGATRNATAQHIKQAAAKLLDPSGVSAAGRALLVTQSEQGIQSTHYLGAASREVEAWLVSLAVRILYRESNFLQALDLVQKGIRNTIQQMEHAQQQLSSASSVASLFPLLARLYRWRSLVAERAGSPAGRQDMALAHNAATVRRDVDTQATLLNSMLRDLIRHSQIEQANKLLSNSTFPEQASNNQLCRYLYYSGRIQAFRLEYTSSYSNLSQCLRKAPTNTGLGFRIAVQRLLVVVQLLMGEVPDRQVFFTTGMKMELEPYLHITQAVRKGDLANYTHVVATHQKQFEKDSTYTLISRLAHQVVKAGLRKLHISYSRLSLQDVADRLGLPSAQSAEFVVAKAVRDGVLDATIHHAEGYVQSHDLVNVYATREPSEAFHRRIAYCLTLHNDAVRGMRYPPDAYKKQLEASRGNRKKESDDKTDEEKAQEIEEELEEDY